MKMKESSAVVIAKDTSRYTTDAMHMIGDHHYPNLKPKYKSIYDELRFNALHPVSESDFCKN